MQKRCVLEVREENKEKKILVTDLKMWLHNIFIFIKGIT